MKEEIIHGALIIGEEVEIPGVAKLNEAGQGGAIARGIDEHHPGVAVVGLDLHLAAAKGLPIRLAAGREVAADRVGIGDVLQEDHVDVGVKRDRPVFDQADLATQETAARVAHQRQPQSVPQSPSSMVSSTKILLRFKIEKMTDESNLGASVLGVNEIEERAKKAAFHHSQDDCFQ